mmetsp:Transcript_24268/g.45891  ORF Transcript_24268/g.45891 Transcript_24268/m.45891 type:complete len:216 (-) Transcript_24268:981-1628(-)
MQLAQILICSRKLLQLLCVLGKFVEGVALAHQDQYGSQGRSSWIIKQWSVLLVSIPTGGMERHARCVQQLCEHAGFALKVLHSEAEELRIGVWWVDCNDTSHIIVGLRIQNPSNPTLASSSNKHRTSRIECRKYKVGMPNDGHQPALGKEHVWGTRAHAIQRQVHCKSRCPQSIVTRQHILARLRLLAFLTVLGVAVLALPSVVFASNVDQGIRH